MGKKILFRASLVRFQRIVEDNLEVGDLVGWRYGYSVSVGHNGENEEVENTTVSKTPRRGQRVPGDKGNLIPERSSWRINAKMTPKSRK